MDKDQSNYKDEYKEYEPKKPYHLIEGRDHKRPIYGVLTEPIRGDMEKNFDVDARKEQITDEELTIKHLDKVSYIPKAHV
jgi:hypothetical protein